MTTVSCLMPTYNRFPNARYKDFRWLIEEGIESFLRQTHADAELIICNDCPGQTYAMTEPHPRVTIWNVPRRFNSLGEKLNAMAGIARGELLCRWDDDDISLPHRLERQVARFRSDKRLGYLNVDRMWCANAGIYSYEPHGMHGQVMMTRDFFARTRGFSFLGFGEDTDIQRRAANDGEGVFAWQHVVPSTAMYIFRWGLGSEHVSGYGPEGYTRMGQTPVGRGFHYLQPFWKRDYVEDIEREAARVEAAQG